MEQRSDVERIKQALAAGRLGVPDAGGMLHFVYASCPNDGQDSPVHRTETWEESVRKPIFRCPKCGKQFEVPFEKMFLR